MQLDGASGDEQTHNHLEEKESFLSEGAYEKEGSDDLYRFPQIVHERKPQMVVQGGLEDLWVIHTSSIGSRGHS